MKRLELIPENLKEQIFMKFLERVEIAKLSDDDRYFYERSLKDYRDNLVVKMYQENELKRQREQVINQKNEEIVLNAFELNFEIETISKLTGLTTTEISEILKNNQF